jgi:hypothetical protein
MLPMKNPRVKHRHAHKKEERWAADLPDPPQAGFERGEDSLARESAVVRSHWGIFRR